MLQWCRYRSKHHLFHLQLSSLRLNHHLTIPWRLRLASLLQHLLACHKISHHRLAQHLLAGRQISLGTLQVCRRRMALTSRCLTRRHRRLLLHHQDHRLLLRDIPCNSHPVRMHR